MPAAARSAAPKGQAPRAGPVRARRVILRLLAARRLQAAEMFARDKRQVDVVTELGVSAQTASRWHRAWQDQGRAGRAGAGRAAAQAG